MQVAALEVQPALKNRCVFDEKAGEELTAVELEQFFQDGWFNHGRCWRGHRSQVGGKNGHIHPMG